MESIPLEMDDIFGEDEAVEDFNPSRLPDLEDELEPMRDLRNEENDEGENANEETDNAELMAKLKAMKGASKHATRKSLPKLDATRLTGERGIPILPKIFKDIPLKGKNHEKEDLKLIMQTLEHWAHRLFPKMTFGEVLERTERLGAKKDVQSCVKRIRLDMPVLATDSIQDEDNDDVQRTGDGDKDDEESDQGNDDNWKENEIDEEEIEELLRDQVLPVDSLFQKDSSPQQPKDKQPDSQNTITDEMKSRIELNKKLAMERRAAKLAEQSPVSKSDSSRSQSSSSGNDKSKLPEVLVSKDSQQQHHPHGKSSTDVQSDKLFTGDSNTELLDMAADDDVSRGERSTAINLAHDGGKSHLTESPVPADMHDEEFHCNTFTADVQSGKLFTEDSDSELLELETTNVSESNTSAVKNPASDIGEPDLPEGQAATNTLHELFHHDTPSTDFQSNQLFTEDSDSELINMTDEDFADKQG